MEKKKRSLEEARLYIETVRERFHGTTAPTFDRFQQLVVNFGEASELVDKLAIISEVNELLSEHNDLIEGFKDFYYHLDHNRASSVESNVEEEEDDSKYHRPVPGKKSIASVESNVDEEEDNKKYLRPVLEKKSAAIMMDSCLDFMNRVTRILKDKDKVESAIRMIGRYERHGDVERVERDTFCLFKEYPELEIELSEYLAEGNARRTVQEMVESKKHKKKEAKKRTDRGEDRELSELERNRFVIEDRIHLQNMGYNMLLLAEEGALALLSDNSERKHLQEEIWIADYFRNVNTEFMRTDLKMEKVVRKYTLLSKKTMLRGEAILQCEHFLLFVNKGIEILTRNWSDEKRRFIRESHERDLQIPAFDWQAAQLTE